MRDVLYQTFIYSSEKASWAADRTYGATVLSVFAIAIPLPICSVTVPILFTIPCGGDGVRANGAPVILLFAFKKDNAKHAHTFY